jgi:apolipoprotein N-acyltransferase
MKRISTRGGLPVALAFGVLGGLTSSLAYASNAIWVAIFASVALILYALFLVSIRQSVLVGFAAGFAFYASQIPWMTTYLGPVPWLALSALEAFIFALGAVATVLVFQAMRNIPVSFFSTTLKSLAIAAIWTSREWVAISFPYDGFPWSRVALSQSNSPLAPWVYWGGNSLLTFVIVFAAAALVFGHRELRISQLRRSFTGVAVLAVFAIPVLTPLDNRAETGTLNIAAVQGNAKAGLLVFEPLGTILNNHLAASQPLLESQDDIDLVIWPENAADKNPARHADAQAAIEKFVSRVNAPLMFGTITERGNQIFNSSILWFPKTGQGDFYDKKRPVAFGEFVPDREFYRALAPDLIDLIPRGYSFGTRDGIFVVQNKNVGTMICFEVAIDDISRQLVSDGAEILVAQSNNSDFGTSNQSAQQVAIARLRAIETGRAMVHISTVGTSAIIMPDGSITRQLETYKADVMQQELPLRNSLTPAMIVGAYFELANNFATIGLILGSLVLRIRARRAQAK